VNASQELLNHPLPLPPEKNILRSLARKRFLRLRARRTAAVNRARGRPIGEACATRGQFPASWALPMALGREHMLL